MSKFHTEWDECGYSSKFAATEILSFIYALRGGHDTDKPVFRRDRATRIALWSPQVQWNSNLICGAEATELNHVYISNLGVVRRASGDRFHRSNFNSCADLTSFPYYAKVRSDLKPLKVVRINRENFITLASLVVCSCTIFSRNSSSKRSAGLPPRTWPESAVNFLDQLITDSCSWVEVIGVRISREPEPWIWKPRKVDVVNRLDWG